MVEEYSSGPRYLQTNPPFWPLPPCPFKNCACCSPTSTLFILPVSSCQWLPVSVLQVSHPSFCFITHSVLVFPSSLVPHHSSPPALLSQHSDPGCFSSFNVFILPFFSPYSCSAQSAACLISVSASQGLTIPVSFPMFLTISVWLSIQPVLPLGEDPARRHLSFHSICSFFPLPSGF